MTTRPTRLIRSSLVSKGFESDQTHHEMLWYHLDGKRTSVRTRLSHGQKEYDSFLLGVMAKQVHLDKETLLELIDCPLTAQQYQQRLLTGGHIQQAAPVTPIAKRPPARRRRKK